MKCNSILFFILAVAIVSVQGGLNPFNYVKCKFYECCQKPYILDNFTVLESNLRNSLFGQPLVTNTIVNALKGHFDHKDSPKKALVLSLHGSTGVGM